MNRVDLQARMPHLGNRNFFGRDRQFESVGGSGSRRFPIVSLIAYKRRRHERDQIGGSSHGQRGVKARDHGNDRAF